MRDVFRISKIKELIPEIFDEIIVKKIKEHFFVFDKESWKEYQNFDDDFHNIIIVNGYLARNMKCDKSKVSYFHIWLMEDEIEKFEEQEEQRGEGIINIHHTTFCKRINIKKYLIVRRRTIHYLMHSGYYGNGWLLKQDNEQPKKEKVYTWEKPEPFTLKREMRKFELSARARERAKNPPPNPLLKQPDDEERYKENRK